MKTKEERIRAYERAISIIKNNKGNYMCVAISSVCYVPYYNFETTFVELFSLKPKNMPNIPIGTWWRSPTQTDIHKMHRISILTASIAIALHEVPAERVNALNEEYSRIYDRDGGYLTECSGLITLINNFNNEFPITKPARPKKSID